MSDHAQARITLHPEFRIGQVDRCVSGSFVEHLGRAVCTGTYEPGHPTADAEGFRSDVAELMRELAVSIVRYPGGNFVSNYVWEDGVGPARDRKPFIDLAWRTIEPNAVGTDEFLQWAEREGIEPMMAVNLGTRGVAPAAALVEYCNGETGSRWADLRIANGRTEPYDVHLWCLGNEMDGPWQIGHKDAHEYGKLAAEAGKAMKLVDPSIALVACGSSSSSSSSSSMQMDTFGEWERIVLSHTFDVVDHIAMHAYYEEIGGDRASFLGSGTAMDQLIRRVVASVDAVAAQRRSDKTVTISFDEWNVWYLESRFGGEQNLPLQRDAPRIIEDVYSGLDAVVGGDLLVTLLNHADRVPVACLARGTALHLRVTSPTTTTPRHGEVPLVTAAATWDTAVADDPTTGALALFLVNRSAEPVDVQIDHPSVDVTLTGGVQVVADHERAVEGPEHAAHVAESCVRACGS